MIDIEATALLVPSTTPHSDRSAGLRWAIVVLRWLHLALLLISFVDYVGWHQAGSVADSFSSWQWWFAVHGGIPSKMLLMVALQLFHAVIPLLIVPSVQTVSAVTPERDGVGYETDRLLAGERDNGRWARWIYLTDVWLRAIFGSMSWFFVLIGWWFFSVPIENALGWVLGGMLGLTGVILDAWYRESIISTAEAGLQSGLLWPAHEKSLPLLHTSKSVFVKWWYRAGIKGAAVLLTATFWSTCIWYCMNWYYVVAIYGALCVVGFIGVGLVVGLQSVVHMLVNERQH